MWTTIEKIMSKVYTNIDKKYNDESFSELVMGIKLVFPYNVSFAQVLSMISVWDMRLITSKHLSPDVKIAIKHDKFIQLFGDVPLIIGQEYKLKGTEKMISKLNLISIIIRGAKKDKKNEDRDTVSH